MASLEVQYKNFNAYLIAGGKEIKVEIPSEGESKDGKSDSNSPHMRFSKLKAGICRLYSDHNSNQFAEAVTEMIPDQLFNESSPIKLPKALRDSVSFRIEKLNQDGEVYEESVQPVTWKEILNQYNLIKTTGLGLKSTGKQIVRKAESKESYNWGEFAMDFGSVESSPSTSKKPASK